MFIKCVDSERFKARKPYLILLFSLKKQLACCSLCLLSFVFYLYSFVFTLLVADFSSLIPHLFFSVENKGLEPLTPCVQGRCSKPTELIPRVL